MRYQECKECEFWTLMYGCINYDNCPFAPDPADIGYEEQRDREVMSDRSK